MTTLLDELHNVSLERESGANVRYMVARALGRIGKGAQSALPALKSLLLEEDSVLVETASEAIKSITE